MPIVARTSLRTMSTESGITRVVGIEVDEAELDAGCSAELEPDQIRRTV